MGWFAGALCGIPIGATMFGLFMAIVVADPDIKIVMIDTSMECTRYEQRVNEPDICTQWTTRDELLKEIQEIKG